ncbi:shikimate kinase [Curtobacterium sp. MCBD17_026]|uniref:shikimate kinase n=1 Tax=Curtobacterium sp. MCBD17_026 TaxID=2175621 RepID=UPI0015E8C685|nr:shikimate kinase [Curtobacterium sp. MCBD17_026]WIB72212.1 shikimate kinase [Curtobacterium sp. MCBD17_026]
MSTDVGRADAPVVVIGPMGAGKSSVGKRVAKALGVPFTDTDRVIVREHGPIPGIFADRGEPAFRALEAEAVRGALAIGGVIAVGGGAVTHADTRQALSGARIVLLTVSPEAVADRIAGSDRPLLANGGIDAWQTIMDERAATYAELAHVVVDTSRRPMSRVVDEVVTWLRSDAGTTERSDANASERNGTTTTAPGSTTTAPGSATSSTTSTEGAP